MTLGATSRACTTPGPIGRGLVGRRTFVSRCCRFTREAKTLASLNHPNIGAIYGHEDAPAASGARRPGVTALILELVEGPMLADLIPTLPPDDGVPLARQIAEALAAAHEQGIVQIATSAHADLAGAMG